MLSISSTNLLLEVSCLIVALLYLTKNKDLFSKITIGYLVVVMFAELAGAFWIKTYHTNNSWIYNILIIFEISYVCLGFYNLFAKLAPKALWSVAATYVLLIASYLIEVFSYNFFKFNIITITISSVCFVVLSLYYYHLLLKQDAAFNLNRYSSFWWVAAVLIFYFGGTVYNLFTYLVVKGSPQQFKILVYVMLVLNLFLYSIWSYAFICSSRLRKLLPSL